MTRNEKIEAAIKNATGWLSDYFEENVYEDVYNPVYESFRFFQEAYYRHMKELSTIVDKVAFRYMVEHMLYRDVSIDGWEDKDPVITVWVWHSAGPVNRDFLRHFNACKKRFNKKEKTRIEIFRDKSPWNDEKEGVWAL